MTLSDKEIEIERRWTNKGWRRDAFLTEDVREAVKELIESHLKWRKEMGMEVENDSFERIIKFIFGKELCE